MNRAEAAAKTNLNAGRAIAAMVLLLGCMFVPVRAAQVQILAPAQHDTIHDNAGNVQVELQIEPAELQGGKLIRILIDGKPAAPDAIATSFMLQGVERGEHWLQALLIDQQGQTSSVSDTVYFTMWQASAIIRAPRVGRGK